MNTRPVSHLVFLVLCWASIACGCKGRETTGPANAKAARQADTLPAPAIPLPPAKSLLAQRMDSMGLLNIAEADPRIAVCMMYTRADNFTGQVLYKDLHEAYLHPDAMRSLTLAQDTLERLYPGYRLVVYDAARPMSVQQSMWDKVKGTRKQPYVSNPAQGGGLHNYGLAVDIGLLDRQGQPLPMGTPVDHLGPEAHIGQEDLLVEQGLLTPQERDNRRLLRRVMCIAGFSPLPSEWWHFNRYNRATAKAHYAVIP